VSVQIYASKGTTIFQAKQKLNIKKRVSEGIFVKPAAMQMGILGSKAMRGCAKAHIFFVDGNLKAQRSTPETIEHDGYEVCCFARADSCLDELRISRCDLLIIGVRMPDMNGVELLTAVKRILPWLPVLVIIRCGDVPTAIRAIKIGASDVIEDPFGIQTLLSAIKSLLKFPNMDVFLPGKALTSAETSILRLILNGYTNGEIADLVHRSLRTVEAHRHRIMHKLKVSNVVELVKRSVVMELIELPGRG